MTEVVKKTERAVSFRPQRLARVFADYGAFIRHSLPRPVVVSVSAVSLSLLLWATSLPDINLRGMTDIGLLAVLPISFYAALGLLTLSFSFVIHQTSGHSRLLLLHLLALLIILHALPPLRYDALRYAWAWKHVGVIDYIQRYGSVNPQIAYLDAYHSWPGFFAASALITEIAGFDSALHFAPWAQLFFNLINLGAFLIIVRTLSSDQRVIWLSAWFFFLANWVGQDYFSPQATTYFLHLVIIGIGLRYFPVLSLPSRQTLQRWLGSDPIVSLLGSFLLDETLNTSNDVLQTTRTRIGLLLMIVLFMVAIASTHQLTPFMTTLSLTAMVVSLRCGARNLPLWMAQITLFWIGFVAHSYFFENFQSALSTFGALLANVDSTLIDLGEASLGQVLVSLIGRGVTVFVVFLAVLGFFRRLLYGYRDLTVMVLLAAPFFMLTANSYGGEMLFRVYLFAVPFLAYFAASFLFPTPASGRNLPTRILTLLISGLLLVGFLFAYFGKDRQYYFTPDEVEAAQLLYENSPANTLLIEGSPNYPTRFLHYDHFIYVPISRESVEAKQEAMAQPVEMFTRWMSNDRYAAAYFIITRSQKAENDMVGAMPRGALDKIEAALRASPRFTTFYDSEDAVIFMLSPSRSDTEPCCNPTAGR